MRGAFCWGGMSRLRRLVLSDRFPFISCQLARPEEDWPCISVREYSRTHQAPGTRHPKLLSDRILMPSERRESDKGRRASDNRDSVPHTLQDVGNG